MPHNALLFRTNVHTIACIHLFLSIFNSVKAALINNDVADIDLTWNALNVYWYGNIRVSDVYMLKYFAAIVSSNF